jgi:S-(hydroxymethyl)mycothiol dehydrogenase
VSTRGLVYAEPGAAPAIEEIVLDEPGPNEVRMRVKACGVCHTDLHVIESGGWHMRFPILLGHEAAGIVEAIGEDVTHVTPGDAVVVAWHVPCGECRNCVRGDARRCADYLRGARRMRRAVDDSRLTSVLRTGGYAEALVVHAACAVPMPAELPFEQACLLACGFSTGAGAALWTTPVRAGSTVAVIGCGGVGLAVVQGAKLAGAERIVAIDIAREKLATARVLGATDVVDASVLDPVEAVRELTDGLGVEFAFSAVGAAAALVQAIRMCAYAGTATLVGVPLPGAKLDIDLEAYVFEPKLTLAVTHGGDTIPQEDFPFLAQAALDGKLDLARFVTSTISLDEVPARLPHIGEEGEIRTVALL